MRYKRKVYQDKKWYEEICLGLNKVVKIGQSFGIVIPKRFLDRRDLEYGDDVLVICLKRSRSLRDEMTKGDLKKLEQFKKLKKKEIEYLENEYAEK